MVNLQDDIQFIQLETTSRCNLSCATCLKPAYRDSWQEKDMTQPLFDRVLDQLPEKSLVHLQGWGEPLLHHDTLEHIKKIKKSGHAVNFTTNGTVLTKEMIDALLASGIDGLTFSMAGNNSVTQDSLRGEGSFSLLQEAIQTFVSTRNRYGKQLPRVGVSYLLTPQTVTELSGAVWWCRQNGVDAFVTVHLTQAGCPQQQKMQFMLSKRRARQYKLLRIRAQASALFSSMHLTLKDFSPTLTPVCEKKPLNSLFISVDGNVSPCVFLCPPSKQGMNWYRDRQTYHQKPLIFGNIQETNLAEIWNHSDYLGFRETYRKRQEYHDRKLAGIGSSLAGSVELEDAVKSIRQYLFEHPAPVSCIACEKLDGY